MSNSRLPEYYSRKLLSAFEDQAPSPKQLAVFSEILNDLMLAETDAKYYSDILEGVWPKSEEILELKLKEVKAKNGKSIPIPQKPTNSFIKVRPAECW